MIGVYFSGTGNTKHCVETFVTRYDRGCAAVSVESPDALNQIAAHHLLVLGYPIYFSNAPKIMRDFVCENRALFAGKQVFLIATMGLFSGDGAGCMARVLRKYGADIAGGLHLKMPDCIGDEKVLKKTVEAKRNLVAKAENKIAAAVEMLRAGRPPREGLGLPSHLAGLFGQRLWFYAKTTSYKKKPRIDAARCIGCGRCTTLCPMGNLALEAGKAVSRNRCTMCYRCFSHCPTQALTILGRRVYEQYLLENYR